MSREVWHYCWNVGDLAWQEIQEIIELILGQMDIIGITGIVRILEEEKEIM